MGALVVQLFTVLLPIYKQIHADLTARGEEVTDEAIIAKFNADIDLYLSEGRAWMATHPKP